MARKTRIEFEGAIYRVITRGNQKRKCKTDEDFQTYLDILRRTKIGIVSPSMLMPIETAG